MTKGIEATNHSRWAVVSLLNENQSFNILLRLDPVVSHGKIGEVLRVGSHLGQIA